MADPVQEEIIETYRSGNHSDAFIQQLSLEGGRLRRHQSMAFQRLKTATGKNRVPLFACGTYQPVKSKLHTSVEPVTELNCSYSEAILQLKELRIAPEDAEGKKRAKTVISYFAARLAQTLAKLLERGDLRTLRPIFVSPLPSAETGALPFGLNKVVEDACALAGADFLYRPLVYRGEAVEKVHLAENKREADVQVQSLLIVRDLGVRNRMVLLVDDVVTTGNTLRAAGELMNLYNEAFARGIGLGKTASTVRDQSGAVII